MRRLPEYELALPGAAAGTLWPDPQGGWRAEELELLAALGERPPVDDEAAFAAHAAEFAARLCDLPTQAPGVLGVALWANAVLAREWADRAEAARQIGAEAPIEPMTADELAAAEEWAEDAEWVAYERAVFDAHVEWRRSVEGFDRFVDLEG